MKSNTSATDEALPLSDIKGPVTQDKRQVVKQVYYTIHIITTIALLTGKTVKKEKYAFYSNMSLGSLALHMHSSMNLQAL